MPTTTFRADLVAGVRTMMTAYIAANPTLLLAHHDEPPAAEETGTPYSYFATRPEGVTFDNSTRERIVTAEIVVRDRWTSNAETSDRLDILADSLLSFISAPTYFHIVANSWWTEINLTPEELGFRISIPIHYMDGSQ